MNRLRHTNILVLIASFEQPGSGKALVFPLMVFNLHHEIYWVEMSEGRVRDVMRMLFAAISYMHDELIIHRDLKPSNILGK